MKLKTAHGTQVRPQRRNMVHHLGNPLNVVIGRTQKLNQTLKRVLPEHPGAAQMARQLGEPGIRSRKPVPNVSERNTGIEKIKQCRSGIGFGVSAVEAVGNVAVLEVLEGDEVAADDAGVL